MTSRVFAGARHRAFHALTLDGTHRIVVEVSPQCTRQGEAFVRGTALAAVVSSWLAVAGKAVGLLAGAHLWLWACREVLVERANPYRFVPWH
jgi:hypothetical protein